MRLLSAHLHVKPDICAAHGGAAEEFAQVQHLISALHLQLPAGKICGHGSADPFILQPGGAGLQLVEVLKLSGLLLHLLKDFFFVRLGPEPSGVSQAKAPRILRLLLRGVMKTPIG